MSVEYILTCLIPYIQPHITFVGWMAIRLLLFKNSNSDMQSDLLICLIVFRYLYSQKEDDKIE